MSSLSSFLIDRIDSDTMDEIMALELEIEVMKTLRSELQNQINETKTIGEIRNGNTNRNSYEDYKRAFTSALHTPALFNFTGLRDTKDPAHAGDESSG